MSKLINLLEENKVLEKSEEIKTLLMDPKYSRRIFGSKENKEGNDFKLVIFIYEKNLNITAIHILGKLRTASILKKYQAEDAFKDGWIELNMDLESASVNASVERKKQLN